MGSQFEHRPIVTTLEVKSRQVSALLDRPELVAQVTKTRLISCPLTQIPVGVAVFTGLIFLDLQENELEFLCLDSFPSLVHLEKLDLTSNRLNVLDVPLPRTSRQSGKRNCQFSILWKSHIAILSICAPIHLPGHQRFDHFISIGTN
jgi:hypothetical protein